MEPSQQPNVAAMKHVNARIDINYNSLARTPCKGKRDGCSSLEHLIIRICTILTR